MLRRMSRRFIGAAMAAITAVVLVLLCCLNLWNYRSVVGQLDRTLDVIAASDGRWPAFALRQPEPPPGKQSWPPCLEKSYFSKKVLCVSHSSMREKWR